MSEAPNADCDICNIMSSQDQVIVFQTDFWRVSLAPDQYYLGRAYVSTLRHVEELSLLTTFEWGDLKYVVDLYEKMVKTNLQATHVTWAALMNHAYQKPRPAPHVHWHVRPRYSQPTQFTYWEKHEPALGKRSSGIQLVSRKFSDPEFGHHHQRDATELVTNEMLLEIRRQLLM